MDQSFAYGPRGRRKLRPPGRRRFRSIAIGLALAVAVAGGVAAAAWLIGGSGSAYSKAGALVDLTTVNVSAELTGDLFPGGSGDVKVQIRSTNGVPLTVTDVVGSGPILPANCLVTFDDQNGISIAVPANGDSAVTTFAGAAHMGAGADTSCQGAVITIPVTLSATT